MVNEKGSADSGELAGGMTPLPPQGEERSLEEELFLQRRYGENSGVGADVDPVSNGPLCEQVHAEDRIFQLFNIPRPTHWSVVWSDLMMTMFILFAVLYIYQLSQREFRVPEYLGGVEQGTMAGDGGERGEEIVSGDGTLTQVYDLSRRVIAEADLGDFADISLAPDKTVRIVLTGDVLFDTGDAELKPAARRKLRKVADLLRLNPYVINVVGHTDNVPVHSPRFPSNWELSVLRATAVTRFLVDENGLPPERFYVTGHSYFRPIAPNDSIASRAKNRRVEIVITRDMPHGQYVPGTKMLY